jgi:hypothetical protein
MSDHHIEEAAGTVTYAIPEVYEMVQVLTVLSMLDEDTLNIGDRGTYSNEYLTGYFDGYIELLEDFAKKSDFHTFYKRHEDYYIKLIDTYRENAPVKKVS